MVVVVVDEVVVDEVVVDVVLEVVLEVVLDAVVLVPSVDTGFGSELADERDGGASVGAVAADVSAGTAFSDDSPPLSVVGLHATNAGTSAASQILRRRATTPTVPTGVVGVVSCDEVRTERSKLGGTFVITAVSEEHQTGRRCTLPT